MRPGLSWQDKRKKEISAQSQTKVRVRAQAQAFWRMAFGPVAGTVPRLVAKDIGPYPWLGIALALMAFRVKVAKSGFNSTPPYLTCPGGANTDLRVLIRTVWRLCGQDGLGSRIFAGLAPECVPG